MRVILALAVLLAPSSAHAFDNYMRYSEATTIGGGNGRYFTGSVLDGFTCSVCHSGGLEPDDTSLLAPDSTLFEEGYEPGRTYDVEIQLADTTVSAVAVEIVDLLGEGAGALALTPEASQEDADKCRREPMEEPAIAAHLVDLPANSRQIAIVDGCGATRLRLLWTAPDASTGPVWLNAGVVAADGDFTHRGDGVMVYMRLIPTAGDVAAPMRVSTTCGAAPVPGQSGAWLAIVAAVLVLRPRRRAR